METKNKKPVLFIGLLVIVFLTIGVTLAYYTTTDTFNNEFNTGNYSIQTQEAFVSPDNWTPGTTTPKTVIATNKGNTPAAVRIKLTPSWEDKNGDPLPLTDGTNEAAIINYGYEKDVKWIKEGDWYYYIRPLDEGDSTSTLIDSVTFNPAVTFDKTRDCDTVNGVTTCTTTFNDYAGGKYTLRIDVETAQYDQYKNIWNTNVEIANSTPTEGTLVYSDSTTDVFGKNIARTSFEKIIVVDTISIPQYAIDNWDCSVEQNEAVMCWYTDTDNDSKYELYIGQEGGVNANPDSYAAFSNYYNVSYYYLNDLNTSQVTSMRNMFMNSSRNIDYFEIEITTWDVTNVNNFNGMFNYFGRWDNKGKFVLKNFNQAVENANIGNMLRYVGDGTKDFEFILDNITLNAITSTYYNFEGVGDGADRLVIDVNNIKLPRATNIDELFWNAGFNAKNRTIKVTNLDAPVATRIRNIFTSTDAADATAYSLEMKNWNTPNVTDIDYMLYGASLYAKDVDILISNVNVSNATTMNYVFQNIGKYSENVNIKLVNFDTSSANSLKLFYSVGNSDATVTIDGDIDVYASDISIMFNSTPSINATINIYSNPTNYGNAFTDAAITNNSNITVNYSNNTTNIDNIIATKSSNSHITKGSVLD